MNTNDITMINGFEDVQKFGHSNMDIAMRMFDELNRNWQAIAAEMGDYTKRSFQEGSSTLEKLMGSKSAGQAIEIQANYAKRAYDDYMQQVTKIGGMYANITKVAYKPLANDLHSGV